jgi:mannose-6-phosphate isomerase-like protein (cupin superfamily)
MTTFQQSRRPPSPGGPIVLGPGEGRAIPGPEGLTVKASGDETGGAAGVLEATSAPGFAAPAHVHHEADEMFYVLDGEFEILVGEQRVRAQAGSFVRVPRGTVHSPQVVGDRPGKVLIIFVPGGAERAFDEFAALAAEVGGPLDPADPRVQAIAERSGSSFVVQG